jgi:hypothetical protein
MGGLQAVKNKTYKHYHRLDSWVINIEEIIAWKTRANGDVEVLLNSGHTVVIEEIHSNKFREFMRLRLLKDGYELDEEILI